MLPSALERSPYNLQSTTSQHAYLPGQMQPPQVDMSSEEDAFQGVGSQCMTVLVLGLNTKLDAALQVGRC